MSVGPTAVANTRLDAIPTGWSITKLGRTARIGNGATPRREKREYWDRGVVPWLNSSAVNQARVVSSPESVTDIALAECHLPIVSPGSVLVGLTGQGRTRGMATILDIEATVNQHLAYVAPDRARWCPDFLLWFLTAAYDDLRRISEENGSTKGGLTCEALKQLRVLVPPINEQRRIALNLNEQTAKTDTLIEEQRRLIEMLRERRKALIEEIVLRGLGSSVKSENLESWLPATPSHWRVTQLGFMSDTLAGYAFPSDGFSVDRDHVRLLRGVNVKPGRVDWADVVYWNTHDTPVPAEFDLQAGDLVFGMDRPFVGGGVRIAAISEDDLPALLLQRVMRIRPGTEGDAGYFRYVISTDAFYDYLEPLFTGVSVPHVSEWQVRKFKMPFPPLDEQRRMARHLDAETAKIDTLIAESERFIELARERRSALITAAVTGQIDVGEAA
ncbi:restriction endonuclease subunit S [Streptomyces microflavus]|uniref:restriction endonuclease subunit S n=1 Tax=Streptomyces microflavus TaxID=1919 RepID=UPI0036CCAF29